MNYLWTKYGFDVFVIFRKYFMFQFVRKIEYLIINVENFTNIKYIIKASGNIIFFHYCYVTKSISTFRFSLYSHLTITVLKFKWIQRLDAKIYVLVIITDEEKYNNLKVPTMCRISFYEYNIQVSTHCTTLWTRLCQRAIIQ